MGDWDSIERYKQAAQHLELMKAADRKRLDEEVEKLFSRLISGGHDAAKPGGDITARAMYRIVDGKPVREPACERAPRYDDYQREWLRYAAAAFDGSPHDLLGPSKPKRAPIPLRVPAKRVSINAGFWMRRAINAAAEPRGIKHALTFSDDE